MANTTYQPNRSATPTVAAANSPGCQAPLRPSEDILAYAQEYARERPDVVAMWCLGIGFVLGWKLKPW
ncbi:MAG: hypothetical protein KDB23_02300 [Planctomycetales bacterium]|nr:hypothetical protein [Planctomycetales bacterium]